MLMVVAETPAFCAVCVHDIFKGSFLGDLRWVLFVYIVMFKVTSGETCFACCFVHRNVKSRFWSDLRWVLFVYIAILKVIL
jgi:hypothetical protein